MDTCFQPSELNGLWRGAQQASRQVAMIEQRNPLECELRETRVQEFARIPPQFEGQPELPDACLPDVVRFPRQFQYCSRCNILTQTRGKNLSRQIFAPHWKNLQNTSTHYSPMRCSIK